MRSILKYLTSLCCLSMFIASSTLFSKISDYTLITFQISSDQTKIYAILKVKASDKSELHIIDSVTGKLIKRIKLPLITEFSWFKPNLEVTIDQEKAYIVDIDKTLYLIDIVNSKVHKIKEKPKQDTGQESSSAMSLSFDGKRLYIADDVAQMNSLAVIHIIDTKTDQIIAKVNGKTGWWNGTSTLDLNSSHLYITNQISYYHNEISVLDTKNQVLNLTKFKIDANINSLAVSPMNGYLYVTGKSNIYVFDSISEKLVDTIHPDKADTLKSIAFTSQGNKFYTLNIYTGSDDGVMVIDTLSKKSRLIKLNVLELSDDAELKSSADGSKLYVFDGNMMHVIDTATDEIIRDLNIL